MNHTERERAIQRARSRALWEDAPREPRDITHCIPPQTNHSYLDGRCQFCEVSRRKVLEAKRAARRIKREEPK